MSHFVETLARIAPTRRPNIRPVGYQRWTNLLFLHWRVPADVIEPLLPQGLSLDTWDGGAWIGLVPFYMSGVRPWWFPAIPGVSRFCETNVRTYVHFQGADPGVWFFSLEAAQALAVAVARRRWSLPYFHARMRLDRSGNKIRYHSERRRTNSPTGCRIEATLGPVWSDRNAHRENRSGTASPGTLEHFLVERYLLYTVDRCGRLLRGQVHHPPYPLRSVETHDVEENLLAALGIPVTGGPEHAIFSEGAFVEIFPLNALT